MRGCVRTRGRIAKPRWRWVRIGHAKRTPEFAAWEMRKYIIFKKKKKVIQKKKKDRRRGVEWRAESRGLRRTRTTTGPRPSEAKGARCANPKWPWSIARELASRTHPHLRQPCACHMPRVRSFAPRRPNASPSNGESNAPQHMDAQLLAASSLRRVASRRRTPETCTTHAPRSARGHSGGRARRASRLQTTRRVVPPPARSTSLPSSLIRSLVVPPRRARRDPTGGSIPNHHRDRTATSPRAPAGGGA